MVTDLGKLLDPIADKILICSALFCVVATNPLQYFNDSFVEVTNHFGNNFGTIFLSVGAILILARELLISAVRMIAASKGIVVQANKFGKIKTIMQDISLPLLILLTVQKFFVYQKPGYIYIPELHLKPMWVANFFDVIWLVAVILFALTVIMTILSGVIYLVQNKKVFVSENK